MRSPQVEVIDPNTFLRVYRVAMDGHNQPLPPTTNKVFYEDGASESWELKVLDTPIGRLMYAIKQALPAADLKQRTAVAVRIQALFGVLEHPLVKSWVIEENEITYVHDALITAAATCPLRRVFLPHQLLNEVRKRRPLAEVVDMKDL